MNQPLETWHVITLFLTVIGAFFTLFKLLLGQQLRHIDAAFSSQNARLEKIELANREEATNWQRAERELLLLKADLPNLYVRREDYIRGQSLIEAKLDGLASKIDMSHLRTTVKGSPYESN